jgi:hypothetical protein
VAKSSVSDLNAVATCQVVGLMKMDEQEGYRLGDRICLFSRITTVIRQVRKL